MDKCAGENIYTKKCSDKNKELLEYEKANRDNLAENENKLEHLYPNLDDPQFNIKITNKQEIHFVDPK